MSADMSFRDTEMHGEQSEECLQKKREKMLKQLCLLVFIMNRSVANKTAAYLRTKRMPGLYMIMAEGTATSATLDMLGLGKTEKKIVFGCTTRASVPVVLDSLNEKMRLKDKGTGIAFTIPLSGVILPRAKQDTNNSRDIHEIMEEGVDNMNTELTHDLIVVVIDEGNCEDVMEAARAAGAPGGTTFHALHSGQHDFAKFFDIPLQEKKDVIVILSSRENKTKIMDAINNADVDARKTIFSLPVDSVTGLATDPK